MLRPQAIKQFQSGFTLMEMLITLTVLAILASLALPSMSNFTERQKFVGAAEQVYGHLQQARSEAIARSAPIYASFDVDDATAWTYGISSIAGCDLTKASPTDVGACTIRVDDGDNVVETADLVLMRFTSVDNDGVEMRISGFPTGTTVISFDQVRGTATGGDVELTSSSGLELNIQTSTLGRIEICSPDPDTAVLNYRDC